MRFCKKSENHKNFYILNNFIIEFFYCTEFSPQDKCKSFDELNGVYLAKNGHPSAIECFTTDIIIESRNDIQDIEYNL